MDAPFLIKQHQQKEHSGLSIRRYINGFLNFTLDWSILQRRKLIKLMETSKLKEGEKYCLALHPSQNYRDLQEMGGVRWEDLKDHTNAVGEIILGPVLSGMMSTWTLRLQILRLDKLGLTTPNPRELFSFQFQPSRPLKSLGYVISKVKMMITRGLEQMRKHQV